MDISASSRSTQLDFSTTTTTVTRSQKWAPPINYSTLKVSRATYERDDVVNRQRNLSWILRPRSWLREWEFKWATVAICDRSLPVSCTHQEPMKHRNKSSPGRNEPANVGETDRRELCRVIHCSGHIAGAGVLFHSSLLRWSRPMWRTGVRFATPVRHADAESY